MNMKKIPLPQDYFDFVKWSPKKMRELAARSYEQKKSVYEEVKATLPELRTFENTVVALENPYGEYNDLFRKLSILEQCSPKSVIRDAAHEIIAEYSEKFIDLDYDRELYIAMLEYSEGNFSDEKKKLKKDDIKLLEEAMIEYRRAGFLLPENAQKLIKTKLKKLSLLSQQFGKNINDYDDAIVLKKSEVDGLKESYLASLPKDKSGNYVVTLAYPHIGPFLSEASNRAKRKELAEKNLKKGGVKNVTLLKQMVTLRGELAHILGYKHHADFRTETRMAKNAKTVEIFQRDILKKVSPLAKAELKSLSKYGVTLGIKKLEHYDVSYVATALKKKLYEVDPETVRAYLPLPHVLKELFFLAESLFDLHFSKVDVALWHKDVLCYSVSDGLGEYVGHLILDLYPREGKYGHAMCADIALSREVEWQSGKLTPAVAAMVCNFRAPQKKGKTSIPSLLSIGEVETLFHEFGHALHMLCGRARHEAHTGANVAWDFVETPSQIMENWVWNEDMLRRLTKHHETGEVMPQDMRSKIIAGKQFLDAYSYTRQVLFGMLDLELHMGKVVDAAKTYREMHKKYFAIELPTKETLFPAGWGHMAGYDAGYYSYLWALVYAKDAFSLFEKRGLFSKEIGTRWRKEILEKGSSEDELLLMKKFLKREPNSNAFLKSLGVK